MPFVSIVFDRTYEIACPHDLQNRASGSLTVPHDAHPRWDGKVAGILSFSAAGAGLPNDPKLRALYLERQDLERQVENLRLMKEGMAAEKYQAELERLATALALKAREIRTAEGNK